ncbi:hypothetical protein [Spiroplasma ixodetis]|uniref:hypothetical protein n=1 Tax=Spiroplasma ixodetis TaxID=2141 RepID=UPI002577E5DD|nr:hypothetical protein [Spiroplasma ixodetis]WJG70950.1 hypothetical protein SIXOD_v1c22510 [Spiroplasma ixodetis Y32]
MVSHKNNLNKFELPVLYLRAKINNKYNQLNGDIIHQNFGVSLKDGYEIKYYSDEQGTVEVTNDNQSPGIVYFTITAANDDPFWEGTTNIFYWKLI